MSIARLVECEVVFREPFIDEIISQDASSSICKQPYESNREYLQDWFKYVNARDDYRYSATYVSYDLEDEELCDIISRIEELLGSIKIKEKLTNRVLPLQLLAKRKKICSSSSLR